MVESPRLHFDDVSTEPERLLRGIADSMTSTGSWNMWSSSDVVVAMSPQHARLCADAGMSRAQVQRRLWELAERTQGNLKRGGNWRPERARALGIDPDDDAAPFKAVKDCNRLHLLVAGGMGRVTAVFPRLERATWTTSPGTSRPDRAGVHCPMSKAIAASSKGCASTRRTAPPRAAGPS